ncbi:hypothetical protein FRC17_008977 [Serendipita sp. 399]|nr:hypothetical protein FRC17_008977 [Serendipita sp. 399]
MKGVMPNHRSFENENTFISFADLSRRFVAPSQRIDLPANIVVTSVDVESGMWDSGRYRPDIASKPKLEEENSKFVPTQRASPQEEASFWQVAETNWETCHVIQPDTTLLAGAVVLRKDLVLNPQTFTPELTIRAAKILDITDTEISLEEIRRDEDDGGGEDGVGPEFEPLSAIARIELNNYRIFT